MKEDVKRFVRAMKTDSRPLTADRRKLIAMKPCVLHLPAFPLARRFCGGVAGRVP